MRPEMLAVSILAEVLVWCAAAIFIAFCIWDFARKYVGHKSRQQYWHN
jgi:hypothetical protein